MEKETIQNYLNNYPEIVYDGINRDFSNPNYERDRELLFNATDEIEKCIYWLVEFYEPSKTMKKPSSTLQLKFYVEKFFGKYISNGSFISAVKILGYEYHELPDDNSIYLSFDKQQRKKYREKFFKA